MIRKTYDHINSTQTPKPYKLLILPKPSFRVFQKAKPIV